MLIFEGTNMPLSYGDAAELLRRLPDMYPNALPWLERVLGEVTAGRADACQYRERGQLLGLALGVWKPGKGYKVRTLFVDPQVRGRGVGDTLLTSLLASPRAVFAERAYITVDESLLPNLLGLLTRHGFVVTDNRADLYAMGRREVVLVRDNKVGRQNK